MCPQPSWVSWVTLFLCRISSWCFLCDLHERYMRVLISICFILSDEHYNNLILIRSTSVASRKRIFGAGVVLILRSLLPV